MVEEGAAAKLKSAPITKLFALPLRTLYDLKGVIAHSSLVGYVIGVIPGAGPSIAAFLSYGLTKKLSKTPEQFGNGSLEGLAASESANNAAVPGALAPLLALGIPGSATAAVMIGALMMQGIQP